MYSTSSWGDDRLQAGDLGEPHIVLPHKDTHVVGDRQFPGGDEEEFDVPELGHGLDEGSGRCGPFFKSPHSPRHSPSTPPRRRVMVVRSAMVWVGLHVAAVPGVHHRHMGVQGGRLGEPSQGVRMTTTSA